MKEKDKGIIKLKNGYWSYRFVVFDNGNMRHDVRKSKDELGNPLTTKKAAVQARDFEYKRLVQSFNENAQQTVAKKTATFTNQVFCDIMRLIFGSAAGFDFFNACDCHFFATKKERTYC